MSLSIQPECYANHRSQCPSLRLLRVAGLSGSLCSGLHSVVSVVSCRILCWIFPQRPGMMWNKSLFQAWHQSGLTQVWPRRSRWEELDASLAGDHVQCIGLTPSGPLAYVFPVGLDPRGELGCRETDRGRGCITGRDLSRLNVGEFDNVMHCITGRLETCVQTIVKSSPIGFQTATE